MSNRYDTAELNSIEFSSVASRYSKVVQRGAYMFTYCPWHDDKHPSLMVGGKKGNFCHCFSCGKSGSVIDYVMAVKNCDFKEACVLLHEDFGIPFLEEEGQGSKVKGQRSEVKSRGSKVKSLYEIMRKEQQMIDSEVGRLRRKREWERREEFSYIPMEYLEEHVGGENSFFNCLRTIFTEEGVKWLIEEYKLGTWGEGAVMFPSIDMEGRVHNIKVQRYCDDKGSERFFHKEDKSTYWLGSILAKHHPELFSQSSQPDGLPLGGTGASILTALVSSVNIFFLCIQNILWFWWRVRRMLSSVRVKPL